MAKLHLAQQILDIIYPSGVGYGGNSIAGGSGWKDTWLGNDEVGQAYNNMLPYLVVYMWKRTS